MKKALRFDGKDYDVSQLSEEGLQTLAVFEHSTARVQEAQKTLALLMKARNAYIADLKTEIIKERTGVDLSALFDT